jgi:hypothetical protein
MMLSRIEWWKALRESSLPSNARLLALTLSTYMDSDGSRCFPGQTALASDCGWSDARSVRKALDVLKREDYIKVKRFAGPRSGNQVQATNQYVPIAPSPSDQSEPQGREKEDQPEPEGRQEDTTNRPSGATDRPSDANQPELQGRQRLHDLTINLPTSAAEPIVRHVEAQPGGAGFLDQVLEHLPLPFARQVDRRDRKLSKAGCAAVDRGWEPRQLANEVHRLDATLGSLDGLKDPAGGLAYRIKKVGQPPPKRSSPPTVEPACDACHGGWLLTEEGAVRCACQTAT